MAWTEITGGSQTATVTTEHTLATRTDGKTYVLVVDTNVLVNGDVLILRLKTKARTGGTSRVAYIATFRDVQPEPNKYSIPVPANIELVATLEQNAGTSRTFDWALISPD